jgi:drug/metabolite transporter (DMT)-like permease
MFYANTIALISVLIVYFTAGISKLSLNYTLLALLNGLFYVAGIYFYCRAVQEGEVSRALPLFGTISLFTLLFGAIFLGEIFTPIKYLGVFLLIFGSFLISYNKKTKIIFNKMFWFAIVGSLIFSFNAILQKYLLNFTDFWTVFSYERIGAFLVLIPFLFFIRKDFSVFIKKIRPVGLVSSSEVFNIAGLLFTTIAYSVSFVGLVKALASTQDFFVLFFAVIISIFYPKILKEEINKSVLIFKIIAIILIFIGAYLII